MFSCVLSDDLLLDDSSKFELLEYSLLCVVQDFWITIFLFNNVIVFIVSRKKDDSCDIRDTSTVLVKDDSASNISHGHDVSVPKCSKNKSYTFLSDLLNFISSDKVLKNMFSIVNIVSMIICH